MNGAVVIPARYESSRFPGKPLVDIHGKSMVQHVYERCVQADEAIEVYVATDSKRIKNEVESFGGKVIMTSANCLTGTDRLAEANEMLDLDFIVNVQGDEPMTVPKHVKLVIDAMNQDCSSVVNCFCEIAEYEISMYSVPKVVVSESNKLIYMSRGGAPFNKDGSSCAQYKQVCIYGYSRDHLNLFSSQKNKTKNEIFEDIEILRFLDLDIPIQMLPVSAGGVAVDTPEDYEKVMKMMS
jgi:3-deoxy-manno-octulosonate cytidylyltransferase (CMP-KDO synthetase)